MESIFNDIDDYRGNGSQAGNQLIACYNSLSWNDSVYESFEGFIEESNIILSRLDSQVDDLRKVRDKLSAVNIAELSASCDDLISQVD